MLLNTSGNLHTLRYEYQNHVIEVTDIRDIGVNGPESSIITIDGAVVGKTMRFSPDIVLHQGYLITSRFQRQWYQDGFRLTFIHLASKQVCSFGDTKAVLLVKEVNTSRVWYYLNGDCTELESVPFPL
jgi:hypothetical protein